MEKKKLVIRLVNSHINTLKIHNRDKYIQYNTLHAISDICNFLIILLFMQQYLDKYFILHFTSVTGSERVRLSLKEYLSNLDLILVTS